MDLSKGKAVNVKQDRWLQQYLKCPVYRLDLSREGIEQQLELEGRLRPFLSQPAQFVYTKVPVCDVSVVRMLESLGFNVVDTQVIFEKSTERLPAVGMPVRARMAVPTDELRVRKIAETSFVYSRFHLDPRISDRSANGIKADWAGNFFKGERGDAMVIAEHDGKRCGFLQLVYMDDILLIDLIATVPGFRKKGIARSMIGFALENLAAAFSGMRVGTQVANIPSQRLYASLGFKPVSASYILHHHG